MSLKSLYNERLRVDATIATGGFSTIYRVTDTVSTARLAAKVGRIHSDPGYAKAIREEAKLLSRFKHRCVVKLYLLPRENKLPIYCARARDAPGHPYFFVMEYLAGGTLSRFLKRVDRLSVPEATAIALEVARGLRYVHRRGYAHNDLKLENVVFRKPVRVGMPFTPVLVDFGIATRVRVQTEAGSLYVMAPEQISQVQMSSPPELQTAVDPQRVDVWGMGVLLYRILGGKLPFEGRNERSLTDRILTSRPTSLMQLASDIPPQLEALVIEGCLAKNPHERLDMLTLGKRLRDLSTGANAQTSPGGGWFGRR